MLCRMLRFCRRISSRHAFEKVLRESYSEVLLDDLEVLRAYCAARGE